MRNLLNICLLKQYLLCFILSSIPTVVIGGSYFENLPELGHSHQSVGFTYTNMSLLPCVHVASVCSYIIVFTLAAS